MFHCTLGNHTGAEYDTEVLEGAQPNHEKPFPDPKVYEESFKTEVDQLVKISLLNIKMILNG